MRKKISLVLGASTSLIAGAFARADRRNALTADQFAAQHARDAEAAKRQGKSSLAAAVRDLVTVSQRTVVLNHIHPRWLRAEVERRLDLGEPVDQERIEQLRALGAGR